MTWTEARAYCRYLGKELPTAQQWERVLRGGERLADGSPNPMPRRSLPWGRPITPVPANLADTGTQGPAAVGAFPDDRSPDGVLDLAGNMMEWTDSMTRERTAGFRVTRGGDFSNTTSANLLDYVGVANQRPMTARFFTLGLRCVSAD